MTDSPTPTAAELLAEWKELLDYNHHLRNDREDRFASLKECKNSERMDVVAARLDEMCEDAGISIDSDSKTWLYFDENSLNYGYGKYWSYTDAADLHALMGYLLSK